MERRIECLRQVIEVLEETEHDYHLACGTLLGAVREGGFIAHDGDMDLFVYPRLGWSLVNVFKTRGFKVNGWRTPNDGGGLKLCKYDESIDLFFVVANSWVGLWQKTKYVFPTEVLLPTIPHLFLDVPTMLPARPIEYLELQYGADWRLPNESWDIVLDPPCAEPCASLY